MPCPQTTTTLWLSHQRFEWSVPGTDYYVWHICEEISTPVHWQQYTIKIAVRFGVTRKSNPGTHISYVTVILSFWQADLAPESRFWTFTKKTPSYRPLARYVKLRLRMRRECRERFPRHWFQRKTLSSDPVMHHGTCVTHVPWCMSGLLTSGSGENVPGIPGASATRNFTYLVRGPLEHCETETVVIMFIWGVLYP